MRFPPSLRAALIGVALLVCVAPPALAQKKVALVIGNAAYKEGPLKNPANDSRAMAAKLRQIGFQVIERQNATKSQMETAIADFGEALGAGAVGLFYYAGHGLQVNGRNFLVPVDAAITTEQRVRLQSVDVDVVLDQMEGAKSGVNLVILDACRNNPFERRFRSAGGGLAQIFAPQGTLIAYSTAPGKVAADGDGPNGIYTAKLLQHMDAPGVAVEEVFKRVRVDVSRETNNEQTPWEASSLTGSFSFVETPAQPPVAAVDKDAMFWQAVKDSDDKAMLEAYLAQFSNGTFAPLVRAKLAALARKGQDAQAPPKPQKTELASAPPAPPQAVPAQAAPVAPAQQLAAAPVQPQVGGAPRPGAAREIDGDWRGSIACGASARALSNAGAFTTYEFPFTVKDGKIALRSTETSLVGGIAANGSFNLSGTRVNSLGGFTFMISFQGREENGRIAANGRWGDRECTLAYVKR